MRSSRSARVPRSGHSQEVPVISEHTQQRESFKRFDYSNDAKSGGRRDVTVSVSASSISAMGPEMHSQTVSVLLDGGGCSSLHRTREGKLAPRTSGAAVQQRGSEQTSSSTSDAPASDSHRRDSTARVESAHTSRDGEIAVDDDDVDAGPGPLRIDRAEADALGMKRHRTGEAVKGEDAPRQRRRLTQRDRDGDVVPDDAGGRSASWDEDERNEEATAEVGSRQPTPRPKRPTTILFATPAFIREEKRERDARRRGPLAGPTPPTSPVAHGPSRQRDSFSLLRSTPVAASAAGPSAPTRPPLAPSPQRQPPPLLVQQQQQQSSYLAPSPWGLSSIKPGSPRASVGSMGAATRRGGSDFAISLWPDEPSMGRASHASSSSSSLASSSWHRAAAVAAAAASAEGGPHDDRLRFLRRPSAEHGTVPEEGPSSSTAAGTGAPHGQGAVTEDKENTRPASRAPPPTGVRARHAAPSSISESLLDIISSSSGSRQQTSQPVARAPLSVPPGRKQGRPQRLPSVASTIMEPDVSPILKLSDDQRRRPSYRSDCVPPLHPPLQQPQATAAVRPSAAVLKAPYDYIAAVTAEELLQDRANEGGERERLREGARRAGLDGASRSRRVCASLIAVFLFLCSFWFAWPLLCATEMPLQPWFHRGSAVEALAVFYVNPIAELHALYRVPAASLRREDDVQRLYYRIVGEGIERLEKAAAPLSPLSDPEATHDQRILFFHQMLVAYEAVQRRALQYARSRDRSRWRRYVAYPLRDVWHYALVRDGGDSSRAGHRGRASRGWWWPSLTKRPSVSALLDRAVTALACLDVGGTDMALIPLCPSLRYREEAMVAAAQGYLYHDVNAQFDLSEKQWRTEVLAARLKRDWDSEVYVETLLRFVRRDSLRGVRTYNEP